MDEIIKRVIGLMKLKEITAYRLCKDNNIPYASFRNIKNGKQELKTSQILSIAEYLNVTPEYLLIGEKPDLKVSSSSRSIRVPIVATVNCGIAYKSWERQTGDYLEVDNAAQYFNPFIVIARSESMVPIIAPGDKILCVDMPEMVKDKKIVVVSYKTEPESCEGNVKVIKKLGVNYLLYSINKDYPPIIVNKNKIYGIYPVVRIIRDIK